MKEKDKNTAPASDSEAPKSSDAMANLNVETSFDDSEQQEAKPKPKRRWKPRVRKLYPGARRDLYPTCTLMWTSCQENLAKFTAFSPSYDMDLMADMLQLVQTVNAMPDETDRTMPHQVAHDELERACTAYCGKGWQSLKRYIIRAKFPAEAALLDLAGQKWYFDASKFNWSAAEALVWAASRFMASHLADLTANRNMSPNFPDTLAALGTDFKAKLAIFRNFEKVTEELTDLKMEAENDLYLKTSEMGQDGQEVFRSAPGKALLFSYRAMLEKINGVGSASLVVTVAEYGTNQPVDKATVTISGRNLSATKTTAGKYTIKQLVSGKRTVTLSAPGFLPTTLPDVVIEPGTIKRLSVKLKRA